MYIVFKKSNKDFCLAINICVFYVYNLFLEYRDLGERSGLRGRRHLLRWSGENVSIYLVSVLDHQIYNLPKFREITSVKKFSSTCWPLANFTTPFFQISDFFYHYYKRLIQKLKCITKAKKKSRRTNYINHERWNVRSDQRRLGFRVGHCQVQLTGVDIYAAIIMLIPFFVHLNSFLSDF